MAERLAYYRVHGANMECTDYARPMPATLAKELKNFDKSWAAALLLLGWDHPPFGEQEPLFVLERKLMIAALDNQRGMIFPVSAYIRRLVNTKLPIRSKFLMSIWALLLLLPSKKYRANLVQQRRSAANRSTLVKAIVNQVLHAKHWFSGRQRTDQQPVTGNTTEVPT